MTTAGMSARLQPMAGSSVSLYMTYKHPVFAVTTLALAVLTTCNSNLSQASPPEPDATTATPAGTPAATPTVSPPEAGSPRPDVLLPIPDRGHAPGHPDEGWCAESTIQQALLYFGAFVPQRDINRAGRPSHPDLYWSDIPVALKELGVSYARFDNESRGDNKDDFLAWIEKQLDQDRPVIAGVKIHPTEHPEWNLDHMVLIVGHERGQALYINTTWGYRKRFTHTALFTSQKGIAFHNGRGRYFAYAVVGPRALQADMKPGRIVVDDEDDKEMRAQVVLGDLQVGRTYQLMRYRSTRKRPIATEVFTAQSAELRLPQSVNKRHAAVFRYRPATE